MAGSSSESRFIVGLDFGTTYSGYAYAHKSKTTDVYTFYNWPRVGGGKPYCKTLTALYYEPGDGSVANQKSWGHPALTDYVKDLAHYQKMKARSQVDLPALGTYLIRFKLHLADKDVGESSAAKLPPGFTITRVITDYLRNLGATIMRELVTKYGQHVTVESVQWCITVPSIWSNNAKRLMQTCMMQAGLLKSADNPGGSPHPLSIVLEPEAASCYCHNNMPELNLQQGDRILVADIGGGTTDIVVQEWIGKSYENYSVKEVTSSSGGLCGGTYVDENFIRLVHAKIPCLQQFMAKNSSSFMTNVLKKWEEIKCSFGDTLTIGEDFEISLPPALAKEWQAFDEEKGFRVRDQYDDLSLTHSDMKYIFDPVVDKNLELIAYQLGQTTDVKVIFVVGGFAGSPYLMTRIKDRFRDKVERIISPVNPGSAVCQGAVLLALNPAGIVSRVARKTYGFKVSKTFQPGDPEEHSSVVEGVKKCDVYFMTFLQKGDTVDVDHYVTKKMSPLTSKQTSLRLTLFSSDDPSTKYTVGPSVKQEASLVFDIRDSVGVTLPSINVSLYFGRSTIEVKAVGENFGNPDTVHQLQVPVDFSGDWV